MSSSSRAAVLSLLRSLLRTAAKFPDYNVREYMRRRTIDAFRNNASVTDPSAAIAEGKAQLEIAQRQVMVYKLYAPKTRSVMEIKSLS